MSRPLSPLSYGPPNRQSIPACKGRAGDKSPALLVVELPAARATPAATATATAATATTVAAATTTIPTAATATTPALGLEAVAAVDGAIAARLEGHFRVLAARRAGHGEELAVSATTVAPATTTAAGRIALARAPAVGTTAGLVGEALGLMKFLFTRREGELGSAIGADKRFVGVRHPTTSLSFLVPNGHRAPSNANSLTVRPM